jgi:hypothetical protein
MPARGICGTCPELSRLIRQDRLVSTRGKEDARVGFDARGVPRWEQRIRSGEFQPVSKDTAEMRALETDQLSLAETRRHRVLLNPYGNKPLSEKPLKSRNALDYMRALSEAIKTRREIANPEQVGSDRFAHRLKRFWRALFQGWNR